MSGLPKPDRSYMTGTNIQWRHGGPPDYTKVNAQYMKERTKVHAPGSLEETVENLVKTWEMEASHKTDPKQWQTVDYDSYKFSTNGSHEYDIREAAKLGTYNMLMPETPFYDAKQSFASSHQSFRSAFSGSFPWELLELFSGPPVVVFSWRHWGTWSGEYDGQPPTGEKIELHGVTIARLNEELKIQNLETFYDPNPFILKFRKANAGGSDGTCPFHKK